MTDTTETTLRDMLTRVEAERDEAIALLRRVQRAHLAFARMINLLNDISAFLSRFPQEPTDE